jgi:hypothetical protein
MWPESIVTEEERLVAELDSVGIHYLSRQTNYIAQQVRAPHKLLADLIRQPSSRVRMAVIALLLAHPEYAQAIPSAARELTPEEQLLLKLLYTAAVYLQQIYSEQIQQSQSRRLQLLPDYYSGELNIESESPPRARLKALGRLHAQLAGNLDWIGSYESIARRWLRYRNLEESWSQSA